MSPILLKVTLGCRGSARPPGAERWRCGDSRGHPALGKKDKHFPSRRQSSPGGASPENTAPSPSVPGVAAAGSPGHGISQQGSKHTQHRCVVNNFCFLPGKNEQQWWDQKGSPFTGNAEGVTARRGLCEVTGDSGHAQSRARGFPFSSAAFLINWSSLGEGARGLGKLPINL